MAALLPLHLFSPNMETACALACALCLGGVNSQGYNESGPVFPESCHSHWQQVINEDGLLLECYDHLPKP